MLAVALAGSGTGRLVWHSMEVREGRRKLLGWAVLVELLIAAFMAMIAVGIADYWHFSPAVLAAIAALLGYLGPKGIQFWADIYLSKRRKDRNGV